MKIKVLPGDVVILFVKDRGMEKEKPSPTAVMVHRVSRGAIYVTENDSYNGIAEVVCHGTSETKGEYWYQYKSKNDGSRGCSMDVVRIERIGGEQIVGRFIED